MNQKKVLEFEIRDLLPIGFVFIVAGIGIAYGLNVMGDVKDDMAQDCPDGYTYNTTSAICTNSTHHSVESSYLNASQDSITGVAKIPEKLPLIATVVVAAVIIGILVRYLLVRFS